MRRWNGWGDDAILYPLAEAQRRFLVSLVGAGAPPQDATLPQVLAGIPPSRLPAHPLISADPLERLVHARGHSLPDWVALRWGQIPAFPDGVAHPTGEDQVRLLLSLANDWGAPVIPYGGGTSVVGHINVLPGSAPALSIDLGRLNRLVYWDEVSHLATFGAGIAGPDLEAQLRARGCTLGHFPQSFEHSTLGGWIVTHSSGQQSLGYGRIGRLFAGGRLESPAGTLDLPCFPASAAGPDLREMVLGSEGRLGILTQATVRASPLPQQEEFHAAFLPDLALGETAVREIMQARLPISMLRLSTSVETQTNLALAGHERLIGALERYLAVRGAKEDKCMLLLGLTGREAIVNAARREALGMVRAHGGVYAGQTFGREWLKSRFRTPFLRNTLWEMGYAIDTLETATAWSEIPALVEEVERALRSGLEPLGERVHVFTHLSHLYPFGSSLYTTYLFRLPAIADAAAAADETLRRWQILKAAASQAIIAHGGTISHQHGVGLDHLPWVAQEKGALGMQMLRDVARGLDPTGMMNPGKLF